MSTDYLKRILTAKVYDVARETPLEAMPLLSNRISNNIFIKREDTQPVFSFKLRGAYNKMANLSPEAIKRGVIAASAGNHAQGVALSAKKMGCRAVIVMPTTSPQLKIDAVKRLGGEVVLVGESYTDSYNHAVLLEKEEKLTFVHPFDDPDVIAGQGTIGMEILNQHTKPIEAIFLAVGGGGLISGVAAYVKQLRPEIKIIGVQTEDSNAMYQSVKAGQRIELKDVGLFSDGTAVKLVGKETFRLVQKYVDDFIIVNTDSICAAIKDVFQETRTVLEPAGAMAIAAAKKYASEKKISGKNLIAISCGANINFDRLRFVAERADVGEMKEAVFAVTIPEKRGSFKKFCELLGKKNITEFNYRISDETNAHIFVGIGISSLEEKNELENTFKNNGFKVMDLSSDELAKAHLRYMVGGRSNLSSNELLYRFEFPERPGALINFLNTTNPEWNISLFHYRNHGADYGRILVGIQVPDSDKEIFENFLKKLSYPYWDENNNPAYKIFL
ncbi:threonine ammonia-lyase, biosynthetic [Candidatus Kinetoplastidibacterium crithidiae]|uniref:L-threonine dehydratase n=1 Tax=Candidatus Kinetoplastidibacterium crithidiae TCC036E TaxID=1208918 RepID=M1LV02_9PROT|nr:threonine ammonia-lyase, biosynthetic [Candidatus Kinetoplastibacterium crithidii]AFZ82924.1 threonine dehydratase biosynthetic 2 [Candidatus Kinetoplastibacterium crithidii (ex Angomonas deanei ATCC 30255)]AGF47926.1 threonine dehydratase [Candidatus Kinetoplastibacterium crithidii TCC036E]